MNQHWVLINDIENNKTVYIFRENKELLIVLNGKISKGSWDSLGGNSFLIDIGEESYLYKHGFFDGTVLALQMDGTNDYSFLINENKYDGDLNTIENIMAFLKSKYLDNEMSSITGIKQSLNKISGINNTENNENYEITNQKDGWSFSTGKYIEYYIKFETVATLNLSVIYSSKKDKFCFTTYDETIYYNDLNNCILDYKIYLEGK